MNNCFPCDFSEAQSGCIDGTLASCHDAVVLFQRNISWLQLLNHIMLVRVFLLVISLCEACTTCSQGRGWDCRRTEVIRRMFVCQTLKKKVNLDLCVISFCVEMFPFWWTEAKSLTTIRALISISMSGKLNANQHVSIVIISMLSCWFNVSHGNHLHLAW